MKVLYRLYSESNKDKQFYEVLVGDRQWILNYNRVDQRLSACGDPGSGWGPQYVNVSEAHLAELASLDSYLDGLGGVS